MKGISKVKGKILNEVNTMKNVLCLSATLALLLTDLSAGSVLSGTSNTATGSDAVVAGGLLNSVSGYKSTIAGGRQNTAPNDYTAIGGGYLNKADGYMALVAGGRENSSTGDYATVSGGYKNIANGYMSLISGGRENNAKGSYSEVLGGSNNSAEGTSVTVIGGSNNKIYSDDDPYFLPSFSVIGGGKENNIIGTNSGASTNSIIGGGSNNTISCSNAVIAGGVSNEATVASGYAVISGGAYNTIDGVSNVISGGNYNNNSSRSASFIGGGTRNTIESGIGNVINGGRENTIHSGDNSTILGGVYNTINGSRSLAAGYGVSIDANNAISIGNNASSKHDGSWVISDNSGTTEGLLNRTSEITNRFHAYFENGYTLYTTSTNESPSGVYLASGDAAWNSISDKTKKENYKSVDKQEILEQLVAMSIEKWNYKSQDESIKHIGPYAQDFNKAYGLGDEKLTISTIDADGIALVAIQALAERNKKLEAKVDALESRLKKLESLFK